MKVINRKNIGVITLRSKITAKVFKTLAKHFPEALKLSRKDEDGNVEELFIIDYSERHGDIANYGIIFNNIDDETDELTLTFNAKLTNAEIAEKYAKAFLMLNDIEKQAETAYKDLSEMLAEVEKNIVTDETASTNTEEEDK